MYVEHLTLGGNSVVRSTDVILFETINLLSAFKIKAGREVIKFPKTDFNIRVSVTEEGAMFDIIKGTDITYVNACSFEEDQKEYILNLVKNLSNSSLLKSDIIRIPDLPKFIYTIPVNPFILSIEEMQIAGEIELYIYYMLYLAKV